MPLGVRLKNYYKKATTLSFYIILLALISILLLSFSLFDVNIEQTWGLETCILSFSLFDVNIEQTWGLETCILACPTLQEAKKIFVYLYRVTTLYFLLDFLWITLYLIASFYDYIGSEYDKVKLK